MSSSQTQWFPMGVFSDRRYSIPCRYFLLKSSIWKPRCFGENWSVSVDFINLYLDSYVELKVCFCNALNSLTTKRSEKNPVPFSATKSVNFCLISPPQPFSCVFPLYSLPFWKTSAYNANPRILSCFYLIFIAIIILVQFYISFGGVQSVHILKNFMSLDNKMSKQAGCFPFLTGTIRVIWVRLTAAFKLMLFYGKDSCFSIGAQFAVANFYWEVYSLGKENGTSSHNASCWNSGSLCVAH